MLCMWKKTLHIWIILVFSGKSPTQIQPNLPVITWDGAWARRASALLGLADKHAGRGFPIRNSQSMTQLIFTKCSVFCFWACAHQRFPVWSKDPVKYQSCRVSLGSVLVLHWHCFLAGFCSAPMSNFCIAQKSTPEGLRSPCKRAIPVLESYCNSFKKITCWNGLVFCLLFLHFFFNP